MPSRTTLGFLAGTLAVMLAAAGTTVAVQHEQRRGTVGGPFAMEDAAGGPVTQADLLGKPSALFFGFTMCPDTCPTTLTVMTEVMKTMGSGAERLNVVFVTVDPQRDTPEVLRQYLSSFDPRIRGFTGMEDQVAAMARAYHVRFRRVPLPGGDYTMDHSAAVLTFDRSGRFVEAIPSGEDEARVLSRFEILTSSPPTGRERRAAVQPGQTR